MRSSTKPTIAKVHGYAVAGGSDIALCCDLIVMADDGRIGYMPTRVWGCPTTAMWVYRVGADRIAGEPITRHSPEGRWFKQFAEEQWFHAAVTYRDSGQVIPDGGGPIPEPPAPPPRDIRFRAGFIPPVARDPAQNVVWERSRPDRGGFQMSNQMWIWPVPIEFS